MWMFRSRRYPMIDGEAEREVKLRIMEVLFSDEIPDPRDIMIICLVDACGIFKELLSRRQLGQVAPRIEQVRKLDPSARRCPGDPGYRTDGDIVDAAASLLGRITGDKLERRSACRAAMGRVMRP